MIQAGCVSSYRESLWGPGADSVRRSDPHAASCLSDGADGCHRTIQSLASAPSMELEIGQTVELMGVENAGLDITGQQGSVTEFQRGGLVSVTLESGAVVSAWPENLKVVRTRPAK